MSRQIYVNLPVSDLPRSKAFFQSLGFRIEPKFSNDAAACVVLGEGSVYAMLLTHAFFQGFAPAPIADATKATAVINCLSCASRQEVDDLMAKAVAAGGKTHKPPVDHGCMYGHGFTDLDGHAWELMWMDPNAKM